MEINKDLAFAVCRPNCRWCSGKGYYQVETTPIFNVFNKTTFPIVKGWPVLITTKYCECTNGRCE